MIKPKKDFSEILEENENTAVNDTGSNTKNSIKIDFNSRINQQIFSAGMNCSKENITSTKDSSKPSKSDSKTSKSLLTFQNTVAGSKFNSKLRIDLKSNNFDSKFKVEEFLVIYYVSIVIRLSKLSDGHKAITEYNKKNGLSKVALAHIYKILGVLTMLSEEKDYYKAQGYFEKSVNYFKIIKPHKGYAISKLALVRCE